MTNVCCVSARPSSQGQPACLIDASGEAPGASGVAADQDVVGARLGDTGRDRADPGFGDQLDADPGARVDLAQVVDELGQVLDRVDVVMRGRRDQRETGHGVANTGDEAGDFVPGDLAAFAGFAPLGDLDLQLFGHREIAGGDPEPSGGDLLDLGVRDVRTILVVPGLVLAAFTGVGAGAEPVHGDREGAVRLRTQ